MQPYANRWSNDNPHQGSAFHKLVVLPTLAPQLARPYQVPGVNIDMPVDGSVGTYSTMYVSS
jgi:hypothetical protein